MMFQANIIDIENRQIYWGLVTIDSGRIVSVQKEGVEMVGKPYLLPGFIDSHVHIESSMLVPSEFARLAVVHGTIGTISDPHEIANVCGMEGVKYMIDNSKQTPFKACFGAPSCVPATTFETAGAVLDVEQVKELLAMPEIKYLSEMMNFPGVLQQDETVMAKINIAHAFHKPVDGHAPGLMGDDAKKYIDAGITTDHECFTAEEALNKLAHGMKILIREGSAAQNFDALVELMHEHYEMMMFCSDDKHPDSLMEGHINRLCARAVQQGVDLFKVLQVACVNPVRHYRMDVGLLQPGDPADFILMGDLTSFSVLETYINGIRVAQAGKSLLNPARPGVINQFDCTEKNSSDFVVKYFGQALIPVIEALDGQLITNKLMLVPKIEAGNIVSDVEEDVLKIVVVNRYRTAPVSVAFIRNIGLQKGAIASSVAHDSHNIVAVGTNDELLCKAVNEVIRSGGGISAVSADMTQSLALPVAGLMSNQNGYEVARAYTEIDQWVKQELGSKLSAPFMTLSFMALLVIPHLKLSDQGLFDGDRFELIDSSLF